jgi:hypothetical protein
MSKPLVNFSIPPPLQKQQQQQQQQQLAQHRQNQQNAQNSESVEWTDEKLVDALKRLDDLHTKVCTRSTAYSSL